MKQTKTVEIRTYPKKKAIKKPGVDSWLDTPLVSTIADGALSIKEIMARQAQGLPLQLQGNSYAFHVPMSKLEVVEISQKVKAFNRQLKAKEEARRGQETALKENKVNVVETTEDVSPAP